MSRLSVSSCVTPVCVYGLAASSAVLILVPGHDCTSTLECTRIAYHAVSIRRTTPLCLLTSDGLGGMQQKVVNLTLSPLWPSAALTRAFGGRSVELCDLITAAPFFMSSLFGTVCLKRFLHQRHSYKGLLFLTSLISRL